MSDEELLAKIIEEAQRVLPYCDEMKARGYEVSFYISDNWTTKKYEARISAKKELKAVSGEPK
jgi:hypothetical protein